MVQPLFLSADAYCRDSWREAFPDLVVSKLGRLPAGAGAVWVLQPPGFDAERMVRDLAPNLGERPLMLMSDEPSEEDALAGLAAGARSYCNGHAAPEVLKQVAAVVENGGVWIGQGLLQRLLTVTARIVSRDKNESAWQARLTPRERETAILLSSGASNKEIARRLDISERTVKAHVGAMLEKLGARDRLQLSLIIHGIGLPAPVRHGRAPNRLEVPDTRGAVLYFGT